MQADLVNNLSGGFLRVWVSKDPEQPFRKIQDDGPHASMEKQGRFVFRHNSQFMPPRNGVWFF